MDNHNIIAQWRKNVYANHKHGRHHQDNDRLKPIYRTLTPKNWAAVGVITTVVLFYLLINHKTHVFEVLPYILILAMILMHVGGHGGHSHRGKRHE